MKNRNIYKILPLTVSKMTLPKGENVLRLFFNEPTKHWHFKEIIKNAGVSERGASCWLRKLVKGKLIKHIKPKGKMPYFISNYHNPDYESRKKLYGLNKILESDLLTQLRSLKNAKVVIIFGSFARGDWHTNSDIDIFVYGNPGRLKFGTMAMGREVEVHTCKTKKDIKEIRSGLINNVVKGYFVKGDIHDLAEVSV